MVGADFTHEGDKCSFETMRARLGLDDPALRHLAEIVHDLDLKDGKFGRPDAAGVQRLVDGLCAAHADSGARVQAALPIFDTLFASFGGRIPERRASRKPRSDAVGIGAGAGMTATRSILTATDVVRLLDTRELHRRHRPHALRPRSRRNRGPVSSGSDAPGRQLSRQSCGG